ncbi:MAG: double-strand break repair helicase AddA [Proteobacteria bacterium]|nr:double-strand break repair helicase AddA [Pseudomonadota bacterium]
MGDLSDPMELAGAAQRRATAPNLSAWVEANAGTGKTKVLTDRVTRLLLAGVPPERILCLTFTKAAAAEMRNRLAAQLGRWAMADDETLGKAITTLIDEVPQAEQRSLARRLFARVLDAPGGIQIQTIHAFCQALLKRFPIEANVPPGFEVMDEAEAATLLRQAQDQQIEELAESEAPELLRTALATVARRISIAEYAELMKRLLSERAWLLSRIRNEAGLGKLGRQLRKQLNCEQVPPLDEAALREAARALIEAGGKTDGPNGERIAAWLADDRDDLSTAYREIYFTGSGQVRKTLATKAAQKRLPGIVDILESEAARLECARGQALVELTLSLLRLGLDIIRRFTAAKRRRGVLDYDDLIVATRRLLDTSESAAWVLYKLDGGIDHVLVDEAQDTNPDQWQVIRKLTEEFFTGESANDRDRTIFVVGDTKQSIFGFQRADPAKLAEMRDWFAERIQLAQRDFDQVPLTVSFRSTPAVLDAVDWVFDLADNASGLTEPGEVVVHQHSRGQDPGRVELWPLVGAAKVETDYATIEAPSGVLTPPHQLLARLIAVHIRTLVGRERRALSGSKGGELLHAGHFMVLVRRRNEFVNALVRELKREQIEVAGVDRLDLGEELAIKDLLAMARFVLLPQDDLNLACLLKSPLVGLDEDKLFALAWNRKTHLWQALRERAREPGFAPAHDLLSRWLARADYTTPFDFFAQALGPEHGRRLLLERLGHEASDPIDELLARALQYQRSEAASLQGFLRWFEAGGGEIKRDLDANRRQEVRILTVHASKGLQAPVVYLPDTTRVPKELDRILAGDGDTRLWLPRADDANEAARNWKAEVRRRSLEEQNRLLYVAMTRAEDRLYVGGWIGSKPQDKGCWYDRIAAGLAASVDGECPEPRVRATRKTFDFTAELGELGWKGEGYELVNEGRIELPEQQALALDTVARLEAWAREPAPAEPDPPTPLAPSQPLPDEAARASRAYSPLAQDDRRRWLRGRLLHDLLRHLPALPPAEREAAARRFLAQPGHGLGDAEVGEWAAEALAVTESPAHRGLFAEDSRAEVPLIGTVKTPRGTFTVSGQVDRLAVTHSEVLIVDYKTNRPPPDAARGVALAYRRQLALYRALLSSIYPTHRVRAFLLWTAAPRLMEIDAETLDASMPYAEPP